MRPFAAKINFVSDQLFSLFSAGSSKLERARKDAEWIDNYPAYYDTVALNEATAHAVLPDGSLKCKVGIHLERWLKG